MCIPLVSDQWSNSIEVEDYLALAETVYVQVLKARDAGMFMTSDDPVLVAAKPKEKVG